MIANRHNRCMPLNAKQFHTQLERGLPPIATVVGDEPLLVQEAADAWRARARSEGYVEREVLYAETGFDWGLLNQAGASMSLFASLRRIELRLGDKGPGKEGSAALVEYAASPPQDVALLVIAGAIDGKSRKAKWFTTLDKAGPLLFAWPIKGDEYTRWIANRLERAKLRTDNDVVHWLAARTEGNLLACQQEIDKLVLLASDAPLDLATAEKLVADHAHFEAFDYVDKLLSGEAGPALRCLDRLREEGEQPLAVLGSLNWALHGLEQIATTQARRGDLQPVFSHARIWGPKQGQFIAASKRLGVQRIRHALRLALDVDRAAKGASADSPWEELVKLTACMTGLPLPAPMNHDLNR